MSACDDIVRLSAFAFFLKRSRTADGSRTPITVSRSGIGPGEVRPLCKC